VGSRIRELRIRAGLTQAELGAPMTRSYVSAVERGRAIPSLPSLLLMASRLGVPVGDLLGQLKWTWQESYTADHAEDDPTPRDR
jgi:transcriptional regulator with XRE-family HTH domain